MPRRQSKFLFACARLARETTHRNPKTEPTLRFRPLDKLSVWIKKIKVRDFLPDHRVCETTMMMDSCIKALNTFSEKVYLKEGVVESTEDNPKWRLSERPPRCAPDA